MSARRLFGTILWASEGLGDEHHAGRCVRELCDRYCSELWIVHVVATLLPEPLPQLERHGREERAIVLSRPEPAGCACEGSMRRCRWSGGCGVPGAGDRAGRRGRRRGPDRAAGP